MKYNLSESVIIFDEVALYMSAWIEILISMTFPIGVYRRIPHEGVG